MTDFDNKKLTETVLYILGKTGGLDFYHAFKILYFAEMKHLAKWGTGFVPDDFRALRYGPVPSTLYSAVKELGRPKCRLAVSLAQAVDLAGEDAHNILLAKRAADMSYLSKSEVDALDESIVENESLTFGQLLRKSHDKAWDEANRRIDGTNIISPVSMAKVMGADETMLDYIEEQMQIESALQ